MKVPVRLEDEDDEEEPSKHPDRPIAKAVIDAASIAEYRREGKTPCMDGTPVIVFFRTSLIESLFIAQRCNPWAHFLWYGPFERRARYRV